MTEFMLEGEWERSCCYSARNKQ